MLSISRAEWERRYVAEPVARDKHSKQTSAGLPKRLDTARRSARPQETYNNVCTRVPHTVTLHHYESTNASLVVTYLSVYRSNLLICQV